MVVLAVEEDPLVVAALQADGRSKMFRQFAFIASLIVLYAFIFSLMGCIHQTAMNDASLMPLWQGNPISDEAISSAKLKWPNDMTLIDIQQGTALLRHEQLIPENVQKAEHYLENAYGKFEDLRDPENFSKAFTPDNQTPYRGRPYERMLTAMLIALIDTDKDRCDMALPALKSAEFLDARWQPFMFGSDAPLVYALMIRCFHETNNTSQDLKRAEDGLTLALRIQLLLDPMLNEVNKYAARYRNQNPATQIALSLLEVGIPSALLAANPNANLEELTQVATAQSLQFLPRVLKNDELPYDDFIRPLLKEIDAKSKKDEATAKALFQIEVAYKDIWENILSKKQFENEISNLLKRVHFLKNQIEEAAKKPAMTILFEGEGPRLKREGEYNEVAHIVPRDPRDAQAGVLEKNIHLTTSCGIHNVKGSLIFSLCSKNVPQKQIEYNSSLKLWSSSFQAMTTAGRKFDKILKGRAQFRMGTEVAALVGAYTALALLNASSHTRKQHAQELQTAALVVGAVAGAAWLAGRASNPEADIRQVQHNFESGYLLLSN